MHDAENIIETVSPPVVVYSLLSAGKPVEMHPIEQLTFMASVIMSRFHFSNANLVCDQPWADYIHQIGMSPFFDEKVVIETPADATLPVFWSTRAKLEALKWAYNQNEGSRSILQLDADVIIWDDTRIDWADKRQVFVGGYREPLHWEAYREQVVRLGQIFTDTCLAVGLQAPSFKEQPVNGGCLFFNSAELLECYISFLEQFMTRFAEAGHSGRTFLANKNDPTSTPVMFSEVMMADQRSLGVILDQASEAFAQVADGIQFFTAFNEWEEYPMVSSEFIHLWKYKSVLAAKPALAAQMEQYILRKLNSILRSHSLLEDLGCFIIERRLEMTNEANFTLIRV